MKALKPENFRSIKVIDGRMDSIHLGITLVNLDDGDLKIVFPEKTDVYLTRKFNSCIKSTEGKDTILLILRTLKFTLTTAPTGWFEKAMISTDRSQTNLLFDFDVYNAENSNYVYIGKIDTSFSSKGWIPSNATKLLTDFIKFTISKVDKINSLYKEAPKNYSKVTLEEELDFTKIYPVLFVKNFKRGVYHKFTDFTGISPDTTINFTVKEENSIKDLTRYILESDINTDSIWGFSDNQYTYTRLDSTFYKIRKIDNAYYIDAPESISMGLTPAGRFFASAGEFFTNKGIFRLFALAPLFRKGEEKITYIFRHKLNVRNSRLIE